jgi:hypothetical protein
MAILAENQSKKFMPFGRKLLIFPNITPNINSM